MGLFKAITVSNINTLKEQERKPGTMWLIKDSGRIFQDTDTERVELGNIVFFENESDRLTYSVEKGYIEDKLFFVKSTKKLWAIKGTIWEEINTGESSGGSVSRTIGEIAFFPWSDDVVVDSGTTWLKCNGNRIEATDYPRLTSFLISLNPDVETITPIMTSLTTPAPYEVIYKNNYGSSYATWEVFDKSPPGRNWLTSGYSTDNYIGIDLGEPIKSSAVVITEPTQHVYSLPTTFEVQGSLDNETWDTILRIEENANWDYVPLTKHQFSYGQIVEYRYYRIQSLASTHNSTNWGYEIGEIDFLGIPPTDWAGLPNIPPVSLGVNAYICGLSENTSSSSSSVGTLTSDISVETSPDYLLCDGREIEEDVYPELFEKFKQYQVLNENPLVPSMTSSTTPEPFMIIASSLSGWSGYNEFNVFRSSGDWCSSRNAFSGDLPNNDFGEYIIVDRGEVFEDFF